MGLLLAGRWDLKTYVLMPLLLMLIPGLVVSAWLRQKKRSAIFKAAGLVVFMLLGWLSYSVNADADVFKAELSGNFKAEGRIASHPQLKGARQQFSLKTGQLLIEGKKVAAGYIEVAADKTMVARDDYVQLEGVIDGDRWVAKRINLRPAPASIYTLRKKAYHCLSNTYYRYLSYRHAALAEAIMLGNRANLGSRLLRDFEQAGIYHILAISGMHISVMAYGFTYFCSKSRWQWVPVVLMLAAFNFIVGPKASLMRATFMLACSVLARSWKRAYSKTAIYFSAYAFLLLLKPSFFKDIGFWLSFLCIGSIIFMVPMAEKLLPWSRFFLFKILNVSVCILAVTLPLNAYFFGMASLGSLLSNIGVLPVFYLLMAVLLLASASILIWPPAGAKFLAAAVPLLGYMEKMASRVAGIGFLWFEIDSLPLAAVAIYYVLLSCLLLLLYLYLTEREKHGQKS